MEQSYWTTIENVKKQRQNTHQFEMSRFEQVFQPVKARSKDYPAIDGKIEMLFNQ